MQGNPPLVAFIFIEIYVSKWHEEAKRPGTPSRPHRKAERASHRFRQTARLYTRRQRLFRMPMPRPINLEKRTCLTNMDDATTVDQMVSLK